MPTKEEWDKLNAESLLNQQRTRAERAIQREIDRREDAALGLATSTTERSEIKGVFDAIREEVGNIQDIDTNTPPADIVNRVRVADDSNMRGEDRFVPEYDDFLPTLPIDGVFITPADGTAATFKPASEIIENYDGSSGDADWSINLTISGGAWTGAITYTNETPLYDATGNSQTVARIPVYRNGKFIATYGAYNEGIRCVNGEPVVEFYGI